MRLDTLERTDGQVGLSHYRSVKVMRLGTLVLEDGWPSWSKALRSGRSLGLQAWVRIPLRPTAFAHFKNDSTCGGECGLEHHIMETIKKHCCPSVVTWWLAGAWTRY